MGISGRPRPTTTTYAVLGLLAMRSWTVRELSDQTTRGLARFWPRARTRVAEEPRRLVRHGWAVLTTVGSGLERREVYSISDAGRDALRAWLGDPGPPALPAMESEHLVRVFLADQGGRDDLLRTLDDLRARAESLLAMDAAIASEYLAGTAEFSRRTAVTSLTGELINLQAALLADWARRSRDRVESWPDDLAADLPVDRELLEAIVRRGTAPPR